MRLSSANYGQFKIVDKVSFGQGKQSNLSYPDVVLRAAKDLQPMVSEANKLAYNQRYSIAGLWDPTDNYQKVYNRRHKVYSNLLGWAGRLITDGISGEQSKSFLEQHVTNAANLRPVFQLSEGQQLLIQPKKLPTYYLSFTPTQQSFIGGVLRAVNNPATLQPFTRSIKDPSTRYVVADLIRTLSDLRNSQP